MPSLEPSDGPLRPVHERVLRGLRRGADAPVAHAGGRVELDGMDPVTVSAARRVWSQRMVNEHASAAVFARLLPQLMECGAPLEYCTSAMRMAQDELHHGALCADVVRALGGVPDVPASVATRPLPVHEGCDALERALRNVLFVGCLAETVAVAFTTEEREQTSDPYVRSVITQISADEVLHARFGWAFVKEAAPSLDAAARARTSRWLRVAFRYLEREEMLEVPCTTPPSEAHREEGLRVGVCDNLETRELFYETVHTAILPGLEAAGFHAEDAWRHRAAS